MPSQPRWKSFLSHASRSRSFLWRFAAVVIGLGFAAGFVIRRTIPSQAPEFADRVLAASGLPIEKDDDQLDERAVRPDEADGRRQVSLLPAIERELTRDVTLGEVVVEIPELASYITASEQPALRSVFARRFGDADAEMLVNFIAAWNGAGRVATEPLEGAAGTKPPRRHANFALGRLEWKRRNYAAAGHYYELEGAHPDALGSRHWAVAAWLKARDYDHVAGLEKRPEYGAVFTPYVRLKLAAARRDWPTILREAPRLQWSSYQTNAVIVSLIAAFGWMLFLAHLGQWPRPFGASAALGAVAFVFGALSTVATTYTIIWQEDILKVAAGDDPLHILLFYVAGVGVREELCKLLLFVPLLPILWRRDHELEVLIVASFVGLGFAIEENATYFANSDATSAAGRFLTANFFHLALTGCNGLALFRAVRWGVRGLNEFVWVFPASILAHGGYDALQSMPTMPEGGFLAMGVFLAACLWYFRSAEELREPRRMTVSLNGVFVFAVSLITATMVAHQVALFGLKAGTLLLLSEILGAGAMVIVFFRIFNEPLSA